MASSGIDYGREPDHIVGGVKRADLEKVDSYDDVVARRRSSVKTTYDSTHRKLKPRHIQLIGIGLVKYYHYNGQRLLFDSGTIGTALYVQIGRGLLNGGPASLFMAFTLWCSFILAVTLCMAEMVRSLPEVRADPRS
jgi:yeast amino acid transporter